MRRSEKAVFSLVIFSLVGVLFYQYFIYNELKESHLTLLEDLDRSNDDTRQLKIAITDAISELTGKQDTLASINQTLETAQEELIHTQNELNTTTQKLQATELSLEDKKNALSSSQAAFEEERRNNEGFLRRFNELNRRAEYDRSITFKENLYPYGEYSIDFKTDRTTYFNYAMSKHETSNNMLFTMITSGDPLIVNLSNELKSLANYSGDEERLANFILAFVHSLSYSPDRDHYARYPIETLVEGGGDCEDTSILYASLLRAVGFDVTLIYPPDHAMVGVRLTEKPILCRSNCKDFYVDSKYYYPAETATAGYRVGESPPEYIDFLS